MRAFSSFYRISGWLALVTSCFIYNAWAIPLRQFFKHYQTPEHLKVWLFLDYFSDLIYLLDLVVVKYRIMVMKNGFWVKDKRGRRGAGVAAFALTPEELAAARAGL